MNPAKGEPASAPCPSGNRTILIVEDDADIRDILGQLLDMEGFKVVQAANGREALDYLRANKHPCLIILDCMMPVMDGFEFRREQESDPKLAAIPVVVISADARVKKKAASMNCDRWIEKPIDFGKLLTTVAQVC